LSPAAHMAEHALAVSALAPLIAIGALRSQAACRRLPRASVAWIAFIASQWLAHVPWMIDRLEANPWLHVAEHALLLAAAVAFWAHALGAPRGAASLGPAERAGYLLAAVPAADLTALMLMAAGEGPAAVAMLAGMLPLSVAAIWAAWAWIAGEERSARAAERDDLGAVPGTAEATR
jgi:cytochrome c oxidase assembly factor CtaG